MYSYQWVRLGWLFALLRPIYKRPIGLLERWLLHCSDQTGVPIDSVGKPLPKNSQRAQWHFLTMKLGYFQVKKIARVTSCLIEALTAFVFSNAILSINSFTHISTNCSSQPRFWSSPHQLDVFKKPLVSRYSCLQFPPHSRLGTMAQPEPS